jgi:methionyl-tRNA formyltransferase
MRIVRELDAGPVADREVVRIELLDTALQVEKKIAAACVPLIARALPRLISGQLHFQEQVNGDASFCRKLTKADAELDFYTPASVLAKRVNGLHPWPATQVEYKGEPLKFGLADTICQCPDSRSPSAPGEVIGLDQRGLLIATHEGILRVLRLQKPGGKMLDAAEFLRGTPIVPGVIFSSKPMEPLVSVNPFPFIRKKNNLPAPNSGME